MPTKDDTQWHAPPLLRVCIVYDRLYPYSIGGAERWYGRLAERLAAGGHEVTYVTSRQWPPNQPPIIAGVRIIACQAPSILYGANRRRIAPLLGFAWGVLVHLARHGRGYDVVHASAMSSLSALVIGVLSRPMGFRAVLDWWEVWRFGYWREYLGPVRGTVGWLLQWLLARTPHQAVAHSALHASRLGTLSRGNAVKVLRGVLPAGSCELAPRTAEPRLVYVGRQIREKQVSAIPPAVALARTRIPQLRACLFGDGPDAPAVREAVRRAGMNACIDLPGFVPEEELRASLERALCLVLPSRREGYGLVVAEAAAVGVPSIVLDHPDSAAPELIIDGINGYRCPTAAPEAIASAILLVHEAGYALRERTLAWYQAMGSELTIDGTLPRLLAIYRGDTRSERSER